MSLQTITPENAQRLIKDGAVLVDIRSRDEFAREHIIGAQLIPMDQLKNVSNQLEDASTVIFHCRSGNRTQLNASVLANSASCQAYILDGGLDAWKKAGLPVRQDHAQPLELNRQVQLIAGSLVALGAVLGFTISPWFHMLSGAIGLGLTFAGATGFCGLARVLMLMPWNKRTA